MVRFTLTSLCPGWTAVDASLAAAPTPISRVAIRDRHRWSGRGMGDRDQPAEPDTGELGQLFGLGAGIVDGVLTSLLERRILVFDREDHVVHRIGALGDGD